MQYVRDSGLLAVISPTVCLSVFRGFVVVLTVHRIARPQLIKVHRVSELILINLSCSGHQIISEKQKSRNVEMIYEHVVYGPKTDDFICAGPRRTFRVGTWRVFCKIGHPEDVAVYDSYSRPKCFVR